MPNPKDSEQKAGIGSLVCFAMKEEARPFEKAMGRQHSAGILQTGIGRQRADEAVRYLFAHPIGTLPHLVLTCGFAGGLDPALKVGEVIFETPSEDLRAKLIAVGAKSAKFFCADRIATTVAEKKKLREQTGADAVEMESEAIHGVCREHGIPCATVRVISDTADEDLPLDFNLLSNPDMSLNFGKLALAIAKSPGRIAALMRLQKTVRFAAERLSGVLERLLDDGRA